MSESQPESQPPERERAKDQKGTSPVNTIQAVLSTGSTAAQANLLLELTEHLAEGKNVQQVVGDVCRVSYPIANGKSRGRLFKRCNPCILAAPCHVDRCHC